MYDKGFIERIVSAVYDSVNMALKTASASVDIIFHNAATVAANGTAFEVDIYKTLTVEIYGTEANSARTVTFYGISESGTLRALMGVRLSDFATGTSTTGKGEIWQFDVSGLSSVVMDLTAITGGSVSVKGKAVA